LSQPYLQGTQLPHQKQNNLNFNRENQNHKYCSDYDISTFELMQFFFIRSHSNYLSSTRT